MRGPQWLEKEAARKIIRTKTTKKKTHRLNQCKRFNNAVVAICTLLSSPHVDLHHLHVQFQCCVANICVHFLIGCVCGFAKCVGLLHHGGMFCARCERG